MLDAQWVDNGPGWVGVLLRDAATVLAVRPIASVSVAGRRDHRDRIRPGAESDVEVRALFAVGDSLAEDPVTGSLNASLAQWLIGTGSAADGVRGRLRAPCSDGAGGCT